MPHSADPDAAFDPYGELQPPVIDPSLTGLDRLRWIAAQVVMAQVMATGVPLVHRNPNGARAVLRIRHDGDDSIIAVAVARLVAHAGRVALHVAGESKGPADWSLHLQSMAADESAAVYFERYRQSAEKLGLDATLEGLPSA